MAVKRTYRVRQGTHRIVDRTEDGSPVGRNVHRGATFESEIDYAAKNPERYQLVTAEEAANIKAGMKSEEDSLLDDDEDDEDENAELNKMTVEQLKSECASCELDTAGCKVKADYVKLLANFYDNEEVA